MLSLEEQVSLTSGASFWQTVAVGKVPSVTMTDGPHGVRKQVDAADNLGIASSEPATCFPPAVGLSQSWDMDLTNRVGAALAREAQAAGVNILLGPGINIKRDPRCGRNFEYFSEDPIVTGQLGAAWVRGLQDGGVGASLKHFALNNQEHDRMRISSDADDRTMREIYLRGFERVVRDAEPWTVMCSYNRINGVHASQNRWLLTDLLRTEWGFDGAVVSDWGAVVDRVAAIAAGLDLQMPGPAAEADSDVVAAVQRGELDASVVETAASRIASLAHLASSNSVADATVDVDAHHELARDAARAAIVLLKNERDLLPLKDGGTLAVIGEFAARPRYQGGGSSHVNPTRVDIALDEIRQLAADTEVSYAQGFATRGGDAVALRNEAVETVREADRAVLFLGLSDIDESEGFDRDHIDLPEAQLKLLRAVLDVQPNTVVVLSHGGVVRLSTGVTEAPAILDGALLGQGGGRAIADVLFGRANPSGRLTETIPERIEDVPAFGNFPGEHGHVRYAEGVFVGYRWYDARQLPVTYPFGHGLSYTTFAYSNLEVAVDAEGVTVRVTVSNTGTHSGREVVQVYTGLADSKVSRPIRELKGFSVVDLEAGEGKAITVRIDRSDLAIWDARIDGWAVEGGDYLVDVGASSRDIRVSAAATVAGDTIHLPLTLESSFAEVMSDPIAGPVIMGMLPAAGAGADADDAGDNELGMDVSRMAESIPVGRFLGQGTLGFTKADLLAVFEDANKK